MKDVERIETKPKTPASTPIQAGKSYSPLLTITPTSPKIG